MIPFEGSWKATTEWNEAEVLFLKGSIAAMNPLV
jgi:hypothetical protein